MTWTYRHTRYAAYLGYIVQAIVNNLPALLFVSFRHSFDLGLDSISLLIMLNFGIQMLIDVLAAKYVDRIGYRTAMVVAHACVVVGVGGMAILPFWLPPLLGLGLCTFLNAIGGGLVEVVVSPLIEALPGDDKTASMSLLHSFYSWGYMLVVLITTLFFGIAGSAHWRYIPLFWMLVPILNVWLFRHVPLRTLDEHGETAPVRELMTSKLFWLFLLLMLCAGASEMAMAQWASFFAEEGLKVSKTVGNLMGPFAFACLMGLARMFFGIYGEKIHLSSALIACSLLCVLSYGLAALSPWPLLALIGCALCGLSIAIMWPGTLSLAARHHTRGGTAMFALLALAGDVGCVAGPAVSGFIGDAAGNLKVGLLLALIFPLAMSVGIAALRKHRDRAHEVGRPSD